MANSELDLSLFVAATDGSAITATGLHRLSGNSFYPPFPAGTEYALLLWAVFGALKGASGNVQGCT